MKNTETAYEKWDEVWTTEAGRAGWLEPLDDVVACAARLHERGARTVLDLTCLALLAAKLAQQMVLALIPVH